MIQRTFDASRINDLINDPSIRPHIGGDPDVAIDLTAAVTDEQNHFLVGEHGGFAWCWSAPRSFEVHTFVLPEGRGRWAYEAARQAVEYMKTIGAAHLWTRVAPGAPHVRRFTLKAGFVPAGRHTADYGAGPVTYDLFDWRAPCL